jgi:uncharacterized protein (DUF2147 family)
VSKRFQGGVLGVGFNPLQAPNAPTGVTGTAGNQQVSVAFTAPTNVGGSAISSYAVLSSPGGFGASGASSPITVTGLTNGTAYTFQVTALNSYGPSPFSAASGSVTPVEAYFIATLGDGFSSAGDSANGVYADASGNMYVAGQYYNGSNQAFLVAKYNSSGVLQWQRKLDDVSYQDVGYTVIADSSGNVYAAGYTTTNNTAQAWFIVKYDSTGSLLWQRRLATANTNTYAFSMAFDPSGNLVISGDVPITSQNSAGLVKLDTSGNLVWQRNIYWSGAQFTGYGCAVATDGSIYQVGRATDPGDGSIYAALIKYDSSGATIWARRFGSGDPQYGYSLFAVAVDASGNVYATGNTNQTSQGGSGSDVFIVKFNSSGTLQWQRMIGVTGTDTGNGIALDSSANVYVSATITNASTGRFNMGVIKYDTDGTLQWQRRIVSTNGQAQGYSISVLSSGGVYVAGIVNATPTGVYDMLLARIPSDGSKTGTYTVGSISVEYAASSLTSKTSTISSSVASYTNAAAAATLSTPTVPSSASTLTSAVATF